ncbi:hypothetical protein [Sphaerotilus sp.]|uniref:hypothetical protein n=1 Tax=Sphaerotilus sp. TaxID=2093942 RepID=UPI0034E22BB2
MSLSTSDAADRLDASRRHLQRALRVTAPAPAGAGARSASADFAAEALRVWWSRHPLRVGSEAAIEVANAVLRPVAQRHPLGLVAGAVLAGGLLVWSRPWRWADRPGLVTGLCRQLVHEVVAQGWPQGLAARASEKT